MTKGFIANIFWVEGDFPLGAKLSKIAFINRNSIPYIAWKCSKCGKIDLYIDTK